MRAFSDNEDLALLSGINPERVVAVTWIIVAALATTAGVLGLVGGDPNPLESRGCADDNGCR